jgi:hypothetical protein
MDIALLTFSAPQTNFGDAIHPNFVMVDAVIAIQKRHKVSEMVHRVIYKRGSAEPVTSNKTGF